MPADPRGGRWTLICGYHIYIEPPPYGTLVSPTVWLPLSGAAVKRAKAWSPIPAPGTPPSIRPRRSCPRG